ncbi:maleylpyruvate isomerase family mycothiol-dependent enzyme [Amaricoccus sp.]|uniref:maleylpyruvate isomerase family mycothiol-dependent enzyme n=1 Tax=Amaricoccus sp. TaxID=1872485 RepID=UPI001B5CBC0E|nr:maleylpyruvate isomerase family mycothiol-dependent enzyme [Amaricoccus sp.]MBP7002177.1 maleylpyruvate isomerase family mycothiol-dependent enzyme [Amaricoccus sp.]
MSSTTEEAAREALRARQGAGARYAAAAAPARELAWARRGTAYFARKLRELTEAELTGPSLLPGWTRAHVIAHVGYNARALAQRVEIRSAISVHRCAPRRRP